VESMTLQLAWLLACMGEIRRVLFQNFWGDTCWKVLI
jgi:hypothetical protein